MFCNLPTCRSNDPQECIKCANRILYVRIKESSAVAVIDRFIGDKIQVRPLIGPLDSNIVLKTGCEPITHPSMVHALQIFEKLNKQILEVDQKIRSRSLHPNSQTIPKHFVVTIEISTQDHFACGSTCPHLLKTLDQSKCILFGEVVGSAKAPFRCKTCHKFVQSMER